MKNIVFALIVITVGMFTRSETIYMMDKNHTKVVFVATHFGISHVEGRFKTVTATLVSKKEDFTDADISMTAEVKSIDTDIDMRDNDLKSSSWFDADKYPLIVFKSTSFKMVSGKNYKMEGNISIHGITKAIVFDVTYNGKALNPMTKKSSVGFTVTGKLNRNDFLVGTGGGNGVVSNEIDLIGNVEFIVN